MKEYTKSLLETYKAQGWVISNTITSEVVALSEGLNGKPVIIPVSRNADLSPSDLLTVLGIQQNTKVVTHHSGVACGSGIVGKVAFLVAKKMREQGIIICNGGFPGVDGLMRIIMNGALSADGDQSKLPPLIVVVTEDLFRKDNLGGMYPEGNIRVLLLEDWKHRPDTMLRGHTLNSIPDALVSWPGGPGTDCEIFHYIEQLGLNPDLYKSPIFLANFNRSLDGIFQKLKDSRAQNYMKDIPNIMGYRPLSEITEEDIRNCANDIVGSITRTFEGIPAREQMSHPKLKNGTLDALGLAA